MVSVFRFSQSDLINTIIGAERKAFLLSVKAMRGLVFHYALFSCSKPKKIGFLPPNMLIVTALDTSRRLDLNLLLYREGWYPLYCILKNFRLQQLESP